MSNVVNDMCAKEFLQALFKIESGNTAIARDVITRLVTEEGDHPYYPLATLYLNQMTDDAADIINDSRTRILPEEFEFPEIDDGDSDEAAGSIDESDKANEPGVQSADEENSAAQNASSTEAPENQD